MASPRIKWFSIAAACLVFGVGLTSEYSKRRNVDAAFAAVTASMTEQQKADLQKLLKNYDLRTRSQFLQEMQRQQREALTVEVILVKWNRGDSELTAPSGLLPQSDVRALKGLSLTGTLNVVHSVTTGNSGAHVRAVVVMQHQLDEPFQFAVPTSGTGLCVQLDSGWKTFPAEYPKSNKIVKLLTQDTHSTSLVVDDGGAVTTWDGFTWD